MEHMAISCFPEKGHISLRNKHLCANIKKLMLIGLLHVNYLNHYVNVENNPPHTHIIMNPDSCAQIYCQTIKRQYH